MLTTVRVLPEFRRCHIVVAALLAAGGAGEAQQAAPTRQPASKAAAILTWPAAKREQYIAALDSFFLTRTVKAGPHAHVLERGRPLSAFEPGGERADDFDRFMTDERVRGVLVLQDGKVRLERYVSPHSPATRWNSFSIAKSITSTLVGAAMKDGSIESLDDRVTRYITALRGSAYDEVTVRQLLTMTSGVKWNEDYTDVNSDVARMYAQAPDPGFDMTVSYVRKLPREAPPGAKWVYKTAETNLVGVLVAEATRKPLADYLSEKIWRAYGMERDAEWMIDDVGHEQGGCCLAMTLRDYGRFGQFILDGARADGKPIVAENWLAEATRTQVSTGGRTGYGYQWWTRADGTFEGRGIYGQTLHIDRARRLVIVLNSATEQPTGRESGQARQEFIAAVKRELDAEKRPAAANVRPIRSPGESALPVRANQTRAVPTSRRKRDRRDRDSRGSAPDN
jgi:CubicO group peptidase (beta-lactamase class C family)